MKGAGREETSYKALGLGWLKRKGEGERLAYLDTTRGPRLNRVESMSWKEEGKSVR
jgi:hypothetical protein